jgi:hypothetical protein
VDHKSNFVIPFGCPDLGLVTKLSICPVPAAQISPKIWGVLPVLQGHLADCWQVITTLCMQNKRTRLEELAALAAYNPCLIQTRSRNVNAITLLRVRHNIVSALNVPFLAKLFVFGKLEAVVKLSSSSLDIIRGDYVYINS